MRELSPDDPSTSQSIESLIESQDIESEHEYLNPLTMLLFHRAFCEYAFNDTYNFLLRDDQYYGKNTFGEVARLMPERAFVLYQQLQQLKDGG